MPISRRLFLKSSALAAAGLLLDDSSHPSYAAAQPNKNNAASKEIISDEGWRLWLDPSAEWKNDVLYLPDEADLATLPVNPPIGGWNVLSESAGIPVSLPATVEQFYWGKAPALVAPNSDPNTIIDFDGHYPGVSWWYCNFTAPPMADGEHLIFAFPAARLRAEVYVNGKLIGYNIITESEFEADATEALLRDQPNQLAIRITNPGGDFNFIDTYTFGWGQYEIPISHGFGGLAGGIAAEIRAAVAVTDLTIYNTSDLKTVTFAIEISSSGPAYNGPLSLRIRENNREIWHGNATVAVPAGGKATVSYNATVPKAKLWEIYRPNLYQAEAAIDLIDHSSRETLFGFRWFAPVGVGSNAMLQFNNKRIVLKSAISWGFWAPNGMFPDRDAAEREVADARIFGLNCLQNHRHMPKKTVLDAHDRAGILRYCEPGAGQFATTPVTASQLAQAAPGDTSGEGGAPTTFTQRYEFAKILAMIKANRSHPSAIIWCIQNEYDGQLHNPMVYYVLRKMREMDPSRILLLKSGIFPSQQVWSMPYSDELLYDDGTGYSGWQDTHTAESANGVYLDRYYNSPTDYLYYSGMVKGISMWGEMASGASIDNLAAGLAWYAQNGEQGYDLAADRAENDAYELFLDQHGFRNAFPTAEALYTEIGRKHYYLAAKMLENGRICNNNDYLVLSGWESTTTDDHSGLVDSLRLFKSNPATLSAGSQPEMLIIRTPHYVVAQGDPCTVDLFLVNEVDRHGPHTLAVTVKEDSGNYLLQKTFLATISGGDLFAELLQQGVTFIAEKSGYLEIVATLTKMNSPAPSLTRTSRIYAVATDSSPITNKIAALSRSEAIVAALKIQFNADIVPLSESTGNVDTIVTAWSSNGGVGWTSLSANAPTGTDDPGLYSQYSFGPAGELIALTDLANGPAQVNLYFSEPYFNSPGQRVFDLSLNGQMVLKNFDIYQAAGGKDKAIVKEFTAPITNGILTVNIPHVSANDAEIAAISVTDSAGRTLREVFRDTSYTDPAGHLWSPVSYALFNPSAAELKDALNRVRDGARLIFFTTAQDGSDSEAAAQALAAENVLKYSGMSGASGPSWLGFWYFARQHPLLNGLPSNCVLDWEYQINSGNGLIIDAPRMETIIGYGHDNSATLGIGAAAIPYGKGSIILYCLPGLAQAFSNNDSTNFDPVTAKRIVRNCFLF